MLYLINIQPGWDAVPILTDDFVHALYVINVALVVGAAVNVLYLGYDARWFVALGGLATTGVGLVALTRIWSVFPFAFSSASNGELVVRVLLVLAMVGSAIALIVQLASRAAARRRNWSTNASSRSTRRDR